MNMQTKSVADTTADRLIIEAYEAVKAHKVEGYRRDDEKDGLWDSADYDAELMRLEAVIETVRAQTIAGVICRLENMVHRLDQSRFVDRTLAENGFDALYARKEELDFDARQTMEAIHDLRQIQRDALLTVAEAWVDRWVAIGGHFGTAYNKDGSYRSALRGMSYDWDPPTAEEAGAQNPQLEPHEWIVDESHQRGAVKILESFLTLVPGLSNAVFTVARAKGLIREADRG